MGSIASFAAVLAVVYAGLVGILYVFQRNLLYLPPDSMPTPAASGVSEMRVVPLQTDDGLRLAAWYAPPVDEAGVTVIYLCGNAGHIGERAFKARVLLDAGYGVLLVAYRGFGGNPGKPTEQGLYADARAAFDFVTAQGASPGRIALYGESLGTGVAVNLAHERAADVPVAAVVLETPYSSIADVAAAHYPFAPVRWLIKDRFDALSRIAGIRAPLFVFHAEDDRVIAIHFARRLFEAAAEPKEAKWFARGGHEGGFDAGAGPLVIDFLNRRTTLPAKNG